MTAVQPTLSRCYRDCTPVEKLRDAAKAASVAPDAPASTPEDKLHKAKHTLLATVYEHLDDQESFGRTVSAFAATAKQRALTATESTELRNAEAVAKDSMQKLVLHVTGIVEAIDAYIAATTPSANTAASEQPARVETTPDGLSMHAPGAKADAGKNRMGLVLHGFAYSFEAVSALGTHGAVKYSDRGFLKVENGFERYSDAMLRHFIAEETEGEMDVSGALHATCVAWNALARLEVKIRELREGKHNVGTN